MLPAAAVGLTRRVAVVCHQLGYYLACLEAALAYVLDATTDSVHADAAHEQSSLGEDGGGGVGGGGGLSSDSGATASTRPTSASPSCQELDRHSALTTGSRAGSLCGMSALGEEPAGGGEAEGGLWRQADEEGAREALATFLTEERMVDELVESLTL